MTTTSGYDDRPDYRVDLLRRRNAVRVSDGDTTLGETSRAIVVDEQDHGLVIYLPAADVRTDLLVPTADTSICPYKGAARYWRLSAGTEPIAWDYPEPHLEVAVLRDHIAFYQDRVRVELGVATPAVSG